MWGNEFFYGKANKYFAEEEEDGSAQDEMKLLAIKLNSSSQREG